MSAVSMLVSLGLLVLWVISLATGGGAAWFTWLVFVCAVALFIGSLSGWSATRRRMTRPAG